MSGRFFFTCEWIALAKQCCSSKSTCLFFFRLWHFLPQWSYEVKNISIVVRPGTWVLQPLLVEDDGVIILSPQPRLCDVVGAVVPVDLPVLPVNVGLRQGAQALQELWVKHQTVGLQHVLGQLQLCLGPDEAIGLIRDATGRGISLFHSQKLLAEVMFFFWQFTPKFIFFIFLFLKFLIVIAKSKLFRQEFLWGRFSFFILDCKQICNPNIISSLEQMPGLWAIDQTNLMINTKSTIYKKRNVYGSRWRWAGSMLTAHFHLHLHLQCLLFSYMRIK